MLEQQYRVLVKEKIADSGVNMLRERFDVDVGVDWTDEPVSYTHLTLPTTPYV